MQQIDPAKLPQASLAYQQDLAQQYAGYNDKNLHYDPATNMMRTTLLQRDGAPDIVDYKRPASPFFTASDGKTYYNEWTASNNQTQPNAGFELTKANYYLGEKDAAKRDKEISEIAQTGQELIQELLQRSTKRYDERFQDFQNG
jgi:hypothetical protein